MKKWLWWLLAFISIVSVGIEIFFLPKEHHHWWSSIPAFFMAFGFFGCCLIAIAAKGLGIGLLKKEDYYDEH